jgi:hypothetical protein
MDPGSEELIRTPDWLVGFASPEFFAELSDCPPRRGRSLRESEHERTPLKMGGAD